MCANSFTSRFCIYYVAELCGQNSAASIVMDLRGSPLASKELVGRSLSSSFNRIRQEIREIKWSNGSLNGSKVDVSFIASVSSSRGQIISFPTTMRCFNGSMFAWNGISSTYPAPSIQNDFSAVNISKSTASTSNEPKDVDSVIALNGQPPRSYSSPLDIATTYSCNNVAPWKSSAVSRDKMVMSCGINHNVDVQMVHFNLPLNI